MKRVASLYLPDWSIDRLRRVEPSLAPPPERRTANLDAERRSASPDVLDALGATAAAERARQCDAPRNTGWRPGARWARGDVDRDIAALPVHQRPPMRELGRRSEAADHPFKAMPPDEGGGRIRLTGQGVRDVPADDPGKHRFFVTARKTGAPLARFDETMSTKTGRVERSSISPDPPLVTVHKIGSRIEIAAVSTGARAIGLTIGMALTQARALVPDLVVRDADPAGDRADLERLAVTLARRLAPVVAISGEDGLFVETSGVAHLHGGEAAMAARLVRLMARFGVTARVAVADTPGAAWALARHGRTGVTPPLAHLPAIAPLPVAALRLDAASVELLKRLGVDTIGQLRELPRAPLVRRFGRAVVLRLDQALGTAPEPLDPVVPTERIVVSQRFAEPIATADAIAHWLGVLVPRLATELSKAGLGARGVLLVVERVDGDAQTIRIGLARPNRDAVHLLRLLAARIERVDPGYGIDALALHVTRAGPLGAEALGPALAEETAPDLAPLVDTLANRGARLWREGAVESDVPERSVAERPPLDPPARDARELKLDDVRRLDARIADHPWHPRWPRPTRLLRRPERLDHVMAELPDYPPARFTWRGTTHRVIRGDGPERITGEWWRQPGEHDAVRDYFQVEDEAGRRFWLFRRGDGLRPATGDLSWYVHGTFG